MNTITADQRRLSTAAASGSHSSVPDGEPIGQFDALYRAYRPFLRRIACEKFHVPYADSDDLVHDVFATYLANPDNVRDVHRYLIGAICNASRAYRKKHTTAPLSDDDTDGSLDDCASVGAELVDAVIRNIVVGAALSRLGPSCRDTLERFYLQGETTASIANSRDTTPGYICRLLSYCRNRARSVFERLSRGA